MSSQDISSTDVIVQSDEDTNIVSSTTHTFEFEGDSFKAAGRKIQRYMCKHCDFVTEKYSSIYVHFKRSHPRLAKAGSPLRHYNRTFGFPQNKHIPTLYACQHCNYITLNMRGFINHSSRKHPRRKVNPIKQGSPITTSVNKKYLEALFMSREEPQKNKRKIQRLLATYHADSKVVQEPPQYLSTGCILCNQNFLSTAMLGQHYELCHSHQGPKKSQKTGFYHCKLCPHEALTRMTLYKHYASSHFMDAFYAWNVPYLEPSLMKKNEDLGRTEDIQVTNVTHSDLYDTKNIATENLDIFSSSTVQWNINDSTQNQISESRIPCILCDFSTINLVELLSHYQDCHEARYPKGLKSTLHTSLMLHVVRVNIPHTDSFYINPVSGASLDESPTIVEHYVYECQLCVFYCNDFQSMMKHFVENHHSVEECVNHVACRISTNVPKRVSNYFMECIECGYIDYSGSKDEMVIHLQQEHFVVSYEESFLTHPITERRVCAHCSITTDVDFMQWHYAHVHNMNKMLWHNLELKLPILKQRPFKCSSCSFLSIDDVELAFHYQNEHSRKYLTFTTLSDRYRCMQCPFITSKLSEMIKHHFEHDNSNAPVRSSTSKSNRYLSCKHCGKIFGATSHLWDHITQCHCPISQLLCINDLSFHFIKYGFWNEDISKSESGRKSNQLPFTNSVASTSDSNGTPEIESGNSSHTSTSSDTGDRLLCKFCSYETGYHPSMSRHLISNHSHNVTFRCFKCDIEFSTIMDCIRHHLCIHGLRMTRPAAYNMLLNDVTKIPQSRPKFMCAWCGYKAFSLSAVLNHFNAKHVTDQVTKKKENSDQYYSCHWCEYVTKNATSMRSHTSSKHNYAISYQSLRNFRIIESDSSFSSYSSEEEYSPLTKVRNRKSKFSLKSKRAKFTCVKHCSIDSDSDFSDSEVYKSTHVRCKHQVRYPYTCRFCMNAYVCATTFLKHCVNEHPLWCSTSTALKSITILPDPIALLSKSRFSKEITRLCELCHKTFETLIELQEHALDIHNGQTIYKCVHCQFCSFDEKKTLTHFNKHSFTSNQSESNRPANLLASCSSTSNTPIIEQSQTTYTDKVVQIESDSSDDGLPIITATGSRGVPINDIAPQRRARKSIRGYNMMDITEKTSHPMSTANSTPEPSPIKETFDGDEMFSSYGEIEEKSQTIDGNDPNIHFEHSVSHDGLLRCSKCDFYSTDSERMAAHIKCTHMSTKDYACKFCDYVSDSFVSLDEHLAEFHKIEKNHQLGLQMRFSMEDSLVTSEAASEAISEMKSRFLYTPTPCLPILHEEVSYLSNTRGGITDGASSSLERFKCSYCGHIESSTFKLEMHMRRHEGNFEENMGSVDTMNYQMNKMGIVYNYP
ncbi:uncharacterized protein LOC120337287 isoform X1 [Styela clava]